MIDEVLYRVEDRVAILTLNRPDRMNAWTADMELQLKAAFDRAAADPQAYAIVLTGAGRAFCAGAELADIGQGPEAFSPLAAPPWRDGDFNQRYSYIAAVEKPVIAAINGATAGIGFVLTLFCDIRLVSAEAKLTTAFARRGLVAEHGSAWLLPRLIGQMNATDLLLSGRVIRGEEAERLGLARTLPSEGFADAAIAYARDFADYCSPRAMATIKRQLNAAHGQSLTDATRMAEAELEKCEGSADMAEGAAHYLEKRKPRFAPPVPPGTLP